MNLPQMRRNNASSTLLHGLTLPANWHAKQIPYPFMFSVDGVPNHPQQPAIADPGPQKHPHAPNIGLLKHLFPSVRCSSLVQITPQVMCVQSNFKRLPALQMLDTTLTRVHPWVVEKPALVPNAFKRG